MELYSITRLYHILICIRNKNGIYQVIVLVESMSRLILYILCVVLVFSFQKWHICFLHATSMHYLCL